MRRRRKHGRRSTRRRAWLPELDIFKNAVDPRAVAIWKSEADTAISRAHGITPPDAKEIRLTYLRALTVSFSRTRSTPGRARRAS